MVRPIALCRRLSLAAFTCALAGCAPTAPAGGEEKTTEPVGLLEDMVFGHFDTFIAIEDLAISNGIELESDRSADWPRSGDATVNFGDSAVSTTFTVDRTDFSRVSRTWSVALDLIPMVSAGQETYGDMTGTWTYWEEGEATAADDEATEEAVTTGWVLIDLAGTVTSADEPTSAVTTVYAIVNADGFVYEAEVEHGDQIWTVAP